MKKIRRNTKRALRLYSSYEPYYDENELLTNSSTFLSRTQFISSILSTFQGKRNVWNEAGFPNTISYNEYYKRYLRNSVAGRVVEAFPDYCWMYAPKVQELTDNIESDEQTDFEVELSKIFSDYQVNSIFKRADILARIGGYAVILIGTDDLVTKTSYSNPLKKASKITFLQVYSMDNAKIEKVETNPTSPRYGKPLLYKIKTSPVSYNGDGVTYSTDSTESSIFVHYSRVLHVPSYVLESDVYGVPALMKIWNDILNLEKITAGGAEMFWQGGFPGFSFEMDKDAVLSNEDKSKMIEEINAYVHSLRREMLLKGVKANPLNVQLANPQPFFDMIMDLIAAGSKIPKRILLGSRAGAMASAETDMKQWYRLVFSRQITFCETFMLRAFVERLNLSGVINVPDGGYSVDWTELDLIDPKLEAEVQKTRTEALAKYSESPELQTLFPFETYLKIVLNYSEPEIRKIVYDRETLNKQLESEIKAIESEIE